MCDLQLHAVDTCTHMTVAAIQYCKRWVSPGVTPNRVMHANPKSLEVCTMSDPHSHAPSIFDAHLNVLLACWKNSFLDLTIQFW